jgi:glycosyltransferase involved in cell wall biosynthesis
MISFIVIARNEEMHLGKCFKSINNACDENSIVDYEIIYVDSNSNDQSIEIALTHNADKIFKLNKIWNAAMGRNIGAKHASGDILCFLDGDMELVSTFIPKILDEKISLRYDLVSGDLLHHYYDMHDNLIGTKREFVHIKSAIKKPITGGSFWIKKEIYECVGGMDNRMKRGEDPEFGLRLAKKGYLLLFLPELYVIHHTELHENSLVRRIMSGAWFFGTVLLYKYNLFNPYTYKRMLRQDSSLIVLAITLLGALAFTPYLFIAYPVFLIIRTKFKIPRDKTSILAYIFVKDIISLICFIPAYKKRIKTENIPFEIVRQGIK